MLNSVLKRVKAILHILTHFMYNIGIMACIYCFYTCCLYFFSLHSEESQSYLFSFLSKIAEKYEEDKRTGNFISELIQLDVPQLFAPSLPTEVEKPEVTNVGQQFKDFLVSYIQRNNLHSVILNQLQSIIEPTLCIYS